MAISLLPSISELSLRQILEASVSNTFNPTNDVIPVRSTDDSIQGLIDSPLTVVYDNGTAINIVSSVPMTIPAGTLDLGGVLRDDGTILRGVMSLKDAGRSFLTSDSITGAEGTVPFTRINTDETSPFGVGRMDAIVGDTFVTLPFGGGSSDSITINGTRKIIVEFTEVIDAYVVGQIMRGTQGKAHYNVIEITAHDGVETQIYTSTQGDPLDFDSTVAPNFEVVYETLNPNFLIQDHLLQIEFFSADGNDTTFIGEITGTIPPTGDITTFTPFFETKFSATQNKTVFHNDEVFNIDADFSILGSFPHAVDTTSNPVTLTADPDQTKFFDVFDATGNFATNNCTVELLEDNTRATPNDSITSVDATTIRASAVNAGVSGTKNLVSEGATAKIFNDGTNWKVVTDAETLNFDEITNRTGRVWFRIQGTQAVLTVGDQTRRIKNISGTIVTVDTIGNSSDPIDSVTGLELRIDTSLEFDDKSIQSTVVLDKNGIGVTFYLDGGDWKNFISKPVAGGPLNSVQFNNPLGSFDGSSDFVFDGTNVGIGLSTPDSLLEIRLPAVNADGGIKLSHIGADRLTVGYETDGDPTDNVDQAQIIVDVAGNLRLSTRTNNASDLIFYTNAGTAAIERLRINDTGQLSAGIINPALTAKFDLFSTTQGFLPPRMATTQRDAISSPASGLVIYNTTTNKIEHFNGTIWQGVEEAPQDGELYSRKDASWARDNADDTIYDNTASGLTATNVNDAIDEVFSDPIDDSVVLDAASLVDQSPVSEDVALQIEFGAAQGTGSDPVQIASDGTVTFNEAGSFLIAVNVQYGRTGTAQESVMNFRALLNGTQFGGTVTAIIDTADIVIPYSRTVTKNMAVGDELTFEVVRDVQGLNEGKLMAFTPSTSGWAASPSASVIISRSNVSGVFP